MPKRLISLNAGLDTLQFQHLSINPNNPLGELQGGTQDNGTFQYEGSAAWYQSVGGDGGLSGFDALNPTNRFHTYIGANADINFAAGDPTKWLYISDPLVKSKERVRFYMPIIADPRPERGGTPLRLEGAPRPTEEVLPCGSTLAGRSPLIGAEGPHLLHS